MSAENDKKPSRRPLVLIALIALAPFVASYSAYYWLTPSKRVNYGDLLETSPAPALTGLRSDGTAFALADMRGKWLLLVVDQDVNDNACGDACRRALHATRQARTIQGREKDRVGRLLLQSTMQSTVAPLRSPDLATDHPDLAVAAATAEQIARLPIRAATIDKGVSIFLLDPRGNLVLRYPADPDIKRLANDLRRLLGASQIG